MAEVTCPCACCTWKARALKAERLLEERLPMGVVYRIDWDSMENPHGPRRTLVGFAPSKPWAEAWITEAVQYFSERAVHDGKVYPRYEFEEVPMLRAR